MFGVMRRTALSAAVLAGVLALTSSGTGAAYYATYGGAAGAFALRDEPGNPGARCGYGEPDAHGVAVLKWIKELNPTQAWAVDTTSNRDHQKVTWQLQIQRRRGSGPWKVVARSYVVAKTAYDDAPAEFGGVKVYWTGNKSYDEVFRGRIVLKWWKNGDVVGWAKLLVGYYSVKWTVGAPDYVFVDHCDGHAD